MMKFQKPLPAHIGYKPLTAADIADTIFIMHITTETRLH